MEMKRKQTHILNRYSNRGFTIVELLVAMVVSLLALAAIYSTFQSQHRSYQVQRETSEMQQNIRTAMYYLERDIRMAGSNPFKTIVPSFGITAANATSITFTSDIDDGAGGSPNGLLEGNETITYTFVDSDGDGNNDEIQRNGQAVAQNIDALNFVYLRDDGTVTATLADIRSVQITVVARTDDPLLYGTKNNIIYRNQQNTAIYGPANDNISRRRLTTTIHCRNLGL